MEKNNDMELINRLSRKTLTENEVYIFPVTLCDNEIDRDFESFSVEALHTLGELFIGKTGISDHSMRSSDQTARIFTTWVEETPGRVTQRGEPYTALKAKAYMVRTAKNEDLIKEIDAGIRKEVSVSCSVKKHNCSVCGKERCQHIRGRKYGPVMCFTLLSEPTDAYEWSFVAVPAQREAGVTKAFKNKEREKMESPMEMILSAFEGREEKSMVCEYIDRLEKEASDGRSYRSELCKEVKKLMAASMPSLSIKAIEGVCDGMMTDSLRQVRDGFLSERKGVLTGKPQTAAGEKRSTAQTDNDYMI